MTLYAKGTFSGNYMPRYAEEGPDVISIHEFGVGSNGEPGPITRRLAELAMQLQEDVPGMPIVGTLAADKAMRLVSGGSCCIAEDRIMGGSSSTMAGQGAGSKGEIVKLLQVMDDEGLRLPILLGHANHVGRVGLQLRHAGVNNFIIPAGLPADFAPQSSQVWTRNRWAWSLRELIGVPALRLTNKF